jgi:hypothetical protein
MRIDVAPAADGWAEHYPCGCGLDGRCDQHAAMMRTIREFWDQPMTAPVRREWRESWPRRFEALWAHSNGYGEPGRIPAQGYDWSGIRDSTPTAVERMYAEVTHV